MTRLEKDRKQRTLRLRKRLLNVSLALCLFSAGPAFGVAMQQPPQPEGAPAPAPAPEAAPAPAPAPAAEAAPAEPAPAPEPTEEEKKAALQKIGLSRPSDIPNPAENPAEAVKMVEDYKEALANPDPPKDEPSEAVQLIDFDPQRSYSRLLYPSVATRVGLTEAQNQRINELMTDRAQKLAQAPKEEWNKITNESEAALKAVLTPEQDERFQRGIGQKTIVLRFSKEKWADVLNWFASEVGLQLVMSAPDRKSVV